MLTRIVPSKPAMVLEGDRKSLVVTDIHVGFESGMAANEVFVGKNSATDQTVSEICEIIDAERPDSVILLGDTKSGTSRITSGEWDDVPRLFAELQKRCDVVLIPGNHDAGIQRLAPEGVSMISAAGMVEQDVLLTHGHTMPSKNFAHVNRIVMGHLHPVFFEEGSVVNGQRVWVMIRTQKENVFPDRSGQLEITIVPSFNRYLYATHKKRRAKSTSPIIERLGEISAARIITLDGTIIGDESIIDRVI